MVIAAAMWNNPHILVLDEPTNYLDRDSLGALAGAIKEYGGGIVMITHNRGTPHPIPPITHCLLGCLVPKVWWDGQQLQHHSRLERPISTHVHTCWTGLQRPRCNSKQGQQGQISTSHLATPLLTINLTCCCCRVLLCPLPRVMGLQGWQA